MGKKAPLFARRSARPESGLADLPWVGSIEQTARACSRARERTQPHRMIALSVIICAHNPRLQYLQRVFDGLRSQTVELAQWELLLVDNASTVPLAESIDLTWHPSARHLREMTLGAAWSRLRGITEAGGEFFIFGD